MAIWGCYQLSFLRENIKRFIVFSLPNHMKNCSPLFSTKWIRCNCKFRTRRSQCAPLGLGCVRLDGNVRMQPIDYIKVQLHI